MQTIRWGILGTGSIARQFALGLRFVAEAQLVAVGSRTQAGAQTFARQFKVPHAYPTYEALASDPEVDAVYIATTNNAHKDNCMLCLQAGKAVLCEKPFALNAQEAGEVINMARQKGVFCMEAMWMRFIPLMRRVQDMLHNGIIGDIRMFRAEMGFPVELQPDSRFFNPQLGGGALLDLGVYPLSLASQILGLPTQIASQASIGPTGVDEQSTLILAYPQGQLALIGATLRTRASNEAIIMGTQGQVRIHAPLFAPYRLSLTRFSVPGISSGTTQSRLAFAKNIPMLRQTYQRFETYLRPLRGHGSKQIVETFKGNGYNYEATEVMDCIRSGKLESEIMPLNETLRVMEMIDTARQQWKGSVEPS